MPLNGWPEEACRRIGAPTVHTESEKSPDAAVQRTRRIARQYGDLFCRDPCLYWAGMAAFASWSVARSMQRALALADLELARVFGRLDITGAILVQHLATGSLCVYRELFWPHLAYSERGIQELESCRPNVDLPQSLLWSFQTIERSKRQQDMELCWQANMELLRYEQETLSQRCLYDPAPELWKFLSKSSNLLRRLGLPILKSPIPGDASSIHDAIQDANIANFEHRWKWISKHMIPAFRSLLANDVEGVKAMLRQQD